MQTVLKCIPGVKLPKNSYNIYIHFKEDKVVILVIDHNPRRKDPSLPIKQYCKSLETLQKVSPGKIANPKIIVARRQPPNLLRHLSLSVHRDQNTLI